MTRLEPLIADVPLFSQSRAIRGVRGLALIEAVVTDRTTWCRLGCSSPRFELRYT